MPERTRSSQVRRKSTNRSARSGCGQLPNPDRGRASGTAQSGSGDGTGEDPSAAGDSEDEIAPSPNMRRVFTRLQERHFLTPGGGSSAISGPASHPKDGTALKKHRTT